MYIKYDAINMSQVQPCYPILYVTRYRSCMQQVSHATSISVKILYIMLSHICSLLVKDLEQVKFWPSIIRLGSLFSSLNLPNESLFKINIIHILKKVNRCELP